MLYLHITKILLLFLLSYSFCRVDSWCKLVFNYGKPTVNMFYDYDYDLVWNTMEMGAWKLIASMGKAKSR